MRGRAAEATAMALAAAALTAVMAAPVLRAPSERLFGHEIVGRHHDPFTVMQQFANPGSIGAHTQPATDWAGAGLARIAGPVAAYHWLVLISFPLSAAAAYLLGRYLALSRGAAAIAALAYAFAPFHVAQAAYHPHVAQTQWLPFYVLALWRCADRATPGAILLLLAAATAVTLSNFYGGLIAAVVTPVALAAHWLGHRSGPRAPEGVRATLVTLALVAAAAAAYASWAAPDVVSSRAAYSVPRADLFLYSAKWWSYLLPPASQPWLGDWARAVWERAGVREGLLEQQVSLGWGIVALGAIAVAAWRPRNRDRHVAVVPVLVTVAAVAAVCSLSPERTIGPITLSRPSAWLYAALPMFRSYARFGVVVQLMAALLAGLGFDVLRRAGSRRASVVGGALVLVAAAEYAVSPSAAWRDVLPTRGHRWLVERHGDVRALDCTTLDAESASVLWLTGSRITLMGEGSSDCTEPNLPGRLAAGGYTHLLIRRGNRMGRAFFDRPLQAGLQPAARFRDAEVFTVVAAAPPVYTTAVTGFWPREHDRDRTWQWMQEKPSWTVVNATGAAVDTTLDVELSSFGADRRVTLELDGRTLASLIVSIERRVYRVAAFALGPGSHRLVFVVDGPRAPAAASDPRLLSCAIGEWAWIVRSTPP